VDRPKGFENFSPFPYYSRAVREPVPIFLDFDKPMVTALAWSSDVLTLPLPTDIVIAEKQVVFDDHHVPLGTVSATQPLLWPLAAGLMRAKRSSASSRLCAAPVVKRGDRWAGLGCDGGWIVDQLLP
jgi:hypothetical protein